MLSIIIQQLLRIAKNDSYILPASENLKKTSQNKVTKLFVKSLMGYEHFSSSIWHTIKNASLSAPVFSPLNLFISASYG